MDLHIVAQSDVVHRLRCDEDELTACRLPGGINQHLHTDVSVDLVHENVAGQLLVSCWYWIHFWDSQFIQTSNR